uniref:C2H2-type domain-containing protein n=1 Tax=Monopterus albus TaxID=43700 RepID=A0A3Q3IBH2_MONAL
MSAGIGSGPLPSYMEPYEGDVEAHEGAEHQIFQTGTLQNRRGAVGSHLGSHSRTDIDVSGELSCLLINEEGYLQDPSSRLTFRGQERLQNQAGGRGGRRHPCNQCSLSFLDSASLKACNFKVHQRIHSGQGLHLCSHCGKGFPSFSDLKTHKCGQTGDKPYCCTCGKCFPHPSNLKAHLQTHTGERPFCCSLCGRSFTKLSNLKAHRRVHTGERPYCCVACGKRFTQKSPTQPMALTLGGNLGVQCLAQGHFDTWTAGTEIQTSDPPVGRQLLYPLNHSHLL